MGGMLRFAYCIGNADCLEIFNFLICGKCHFLGFISVVYVVN